MKLNILALFSMSALIVGCDWGSSNSGPTEKYTLTAIDGYLSDAEVYVDRNKDGIADDDELAGTTDSNGEIELDNEDADYPVIVRAIAGTTKDSDYSEAVSTTYEMIADAGSVVVTPYTSLAYLYDMSIEELVEELDSEDSFSFDRSILSGDYSALSSDAAIIAQALARSVAPVFGEFIADNYDSGSDNTTLLKSYLATMVDMFKTEIANGTEISSLSDSVIDFEKDSNGNVVSMVISSISDSESDIETGSNLSASRYAINDTGITECTGNSSSVVIDRATDDSYFGQDCDYGRDTNAFMNSDDNGHAGFNFVKISSAGAELSADELSWDCVQDNITGLMWEVKTDDGGLRDKDWDYTWYNSDDYTNGGDGYEGTPNGGSCVDTVNCDTEKYVAKVNESSLCGFTDWRMPASNELRSLVHYGIDGPYSVDKPSIDEDYFDNTSGGNYWSSSPSADNSSNARRVGFVTGFYVDTVKTTASSVRLVRTGTD